MVSDARVPKRNVISPEGRALTIDNLPSCDTVRWVPRVKAELVTAVRGGLLSFNEACERYELTPEELLAWQDSMDHFGMKGLRATKPQDYRH